MLLEALLRVAYPFLAAEDMLVMEFLETLLMWSYG